MALVAIGVAPLGWPGSPVFDARVTLVSLGLPDWMHFMGAAAMLLSLAYYARLVAIGFMTPTATVRQAAGDWPHWPRLPKFDDDEAGTTAIEPAAAGESAAFADGGGSAAAAAEANEEGPHRQPRFSIRHRLAAGWRLNRPLRASVLVLATALLAAAIAAGAFGASDAAQSGIALDGAAGPPPNPSAVDNGASPTPEPSAVASSGPTLALPLSPTPGASPTGPAPSAGPSDSPQATVGD
jgi:hypothetical protein